MPCIMNIYFCLSTGKKMSYPFEWRPVSETLSENYKEFFDDGSMMHDAVISEPLGVIAPKPMVDVAKKIYNMDVRSDDIWIVTFPKCGTTWTQVHMLNIIWFFFPKKNVHNNWVCIINSYFFRNWSGKLLMI